MKFFSIVVASILSQAAAAPSGAGACPAGEAAPGGPHLTGSPGLVGELSEGNYVVSVAGNTVAFDGTPIETGLEFDIEVSGADFKGILIRVGGARDDQVTSSDLTAPAGACGDVGSVTHSDNSLKSVGTANVALDAAGLLDVDISIVLENTGGASTFYYSAFQINAVGESEPEEPVEEGTAAPTAAEPVEGETEAPAAETTEPPAATPTEDAPVTPPSSNAIALGGAGALLAGIVTLFF